jgi:prolyl-tRNA editing enzyme YbaK/EbsC (Cys-tRNA(Pro) deacylase)
MTMSIETAREYLKPWNRDTDIIEFNVSSATVALAAKALGTEEARIAKTLKMKYNELEKIAKAKKWVDVCKEKE